MQNKLLEQGNKVDDLQSSIEEFKKLKTKGSIVTGLIQQCQAQFNQELILPIKKEVVSQMKQIQEEFMTKKDSQELEKMIKD